MKELWQLYDDQGRPIQGKGATKLDVFGKGLLHAATHVWIWRMREGKLEVLVQKRAAGKYTWPNLYDIPAAGHPDLGENPLEAGIRETKEEIGVDLKEEDFELVGVLRIYMSAPNGAIENEIRWIYLVRLDDDFETKLEEAEVQLLEWKSFETFKKEVRDNDNHEIYVPQTLPYFEVLIQAIERAASS